jgi:hypothetical protein
MVDIPNSRLPAGDRIAVAAIVIALAGAIGAVALEHAYPDASVTMWRWILAACTVVGVGACIYLFIDLVIRPRWPLKFGRRTRAAIGTAILCAVFGGLFVGSHWSFRSLPAIAPAPTAPAPVAPVTPPPAKSWVTPEEIESQRKLGHTLLKFSADQLITMELEGQSVQLYVNNWIKIDYPIAINPTPYSDKKKHYDAVEITEVPAASIFPIVVQSGILALFDPQKWADKLVSFGKRDRLKAYCRFREIKPGEPTGPYHIRMDVMIVDECELP